MFENDIVELTAAEMVAGANVGVARRMVSIFNKLNTKKHDRKRGEWENDIVGALCELSASQYFNLGWTGAVIGNAVPDVGGLLETRAVWSEGDRLIIRDDDKPKKDMPFLKVYANGRKFQMCGWLFGHEAMIEGAKTDPTGEGREPEWFVDNDKLHSMKSLRDWVNASRPKL